MFYPWLWRVLPGKLPIKLLILSVAFSSLLWLLLTQVFPALDLFLASDPTIES